MPTWKAAIAKHIELWHGMYKELFSSMCIECGKSNTTKVEVDKQIIFHTMEKQCSCEQCGNFSLAAFKNAYWVKVMSILWENN